jgi:hypothetical protein
MKAWFGLRKPLDSPLDNLPAQPKSSREAWFCPLIPSKTLEEHSKIEPFQEK